MEVICPNCEGGTPVGSFPLGGLGVFQSEIPCVWCGMSLPLESPDDDVIRQLIEELPGASYDACQEALWDNNHEYDKAAQHLRSKGRSGQSDLVED